MTHDLAQSDELQMTHEFISNVLGVRREGVTVAARRLQEMGMISYVRGHIQILDREELLAHVCECYQVVKAEKQSLAWSTLRFTLSSSFLNLEGSVIPGASCYCLRGLLA
jgi:hypothetical protein